MELKATMTSNEFTHWLAFFNLQPQDPERSDLRTASIVQAIYNTSANKRRGKEIKLSDCVLEFDRKKKHKKRISPKELMLKMQCWLGNSGKAKRD